jgi:hypothetical protein
VLSFENLLNARNKGTRTGGADGRRTAPKANPTNDLATGMILAELIRGQKENKTVASVLEVHGEAITAQCLRDLLTKLEQSKHPRVAVEVK